MPVSTLSRYKTKRIKKALESFEWHVTHTNDDGYSLCTKCLRRSVKELNNLTGRRLTEVGIYAVGNACLRATGDWSTSTKFAVNWAIGQYATAVSNG